MIGDLAKNISFKKVSKRFSMWISGNFSRKGNYLFDLSNFLVALKLFRFV